MLHAISQNKSSLARKRYHFMSRTQEGDRRTQEDEITSIVFGPMDFMPPAEVFAIWRAILDTQHFELAHLPQNPPESVSIHFWPQHAIKKKGKSFIEPDLRIEFKWPTTRLILLLEAKWNASLGDHQLQDQWKYALTLDEQLQAYHLFIGKHIGNAVSARSVRNVWSGETDRLLLLTWGGLCAALEVIFKNEGNFSDMAQKYAELNLKFLKSAGISSFRGFRYGLSGMVPCPNIQITPLFFSA